MIEVRGAGGSFHVRPRAGARVDKLLLLECLQCSLVQRNALALDLRTLGPIHAKPLEILLGLFHCMRFDPWRVNVLVAEYHAAVS